MSSTHIKITVPKIGPVKIEVSGVSGSSCTMLTEGIEKALGGQVIDEEKTREFYEVEEQGNEEIQSQSQW